MPDSFISPPGAVDTYTPLNHTDSLNIWVGGAGDHKDEYIQGVLIQKATKHMDRAMNTYIGKYGGRRVELKDVLKKENRSSPQGINVSVGYDDEDEIYGVIVKYLANNPSAKINLLGHSWGGPPVMRITDKLADHQMRVNLLITIDAVCLLTVFAPDNQAFWMNIYLTSTFRDLLLLLPVMGQILGAALDILISNLGDAVATLGGRIRHEDGAGHNFPISHLIHTQVWWMLDNMNRTYRGVLGLDLQQQKQQQNPNPPSPEQENTNGIPPPYPTEGLDEIPEDTSWPDFSDEEEGEDPESGDPENEYGFGDSADPEESDSAPDESYGESIMDSEDYSGSDDEMDLSLDVASDGHIDVSPYETVTVSFEDPFDSGDVSS